MASEVSPDICAIDLNVVRAFYHSQIEPGEPSASSVLAAAMMLSVLHVLSLPIVFLEDAGVHLQDSGTSTGSGS